MSFEWEKGQLKHTDAKGAVTLVPFEEVQEYVGKLHMSERQSPVPPYPVEVLALEAATDTAVADAAALQPDALRVAVETALAKGEAALLAADAAADKAQEYAGTASDAANAAFNSLRELRDLAATLRPEPEKPAPLADVLDQTSAGARVESPNSEQPPLAAAPKTE